MKNFLTAFLIVFGFVAEANAQTTIASMFASGTNTFLAMIKLVQYASYLIGAYLILGAILKLPQLSDPQARVAPKTPIIMFFVGIAIFTLTGSISVMSNTMSMGNGPGNWLMPQATGGGSGLMGPAIKGVLTFMQLIGYIAFIRGFLMLNQSGQGKEGMLSRGLTHILGGIACINVKITAAMLGATFAPGMNISQYL